MLYERRTFIVNASTSSSFLVVESVIKAFMEVYFLWE